MDIKISKADVIWSYVAQFFQLASGIIVLPYVLNMLSAEEIGLNYLMLTIGSMVALLDFGFAPQFGRNISYIYGGAQELKKEGIQCVDNVDINYHLLATMINVAKKVYGFLSLLVLIIMMTAGTGYMYLITDGFSSIHNSFWIWTVYSISVYFQIYVTYYNSLLLGSGKIKESKISIILSKVAYIFLSYLLIYLGFSLLGLCIANLITPFFVRCICKYFYFTKDLNSKLNAEYVTKQEVSQLFEVILYNAKKLGINFLGSYGINKMGMFIAGLYLSLTDVSAYGLMIQLVTLIGTVSLMLFTTMQPAFSVYRVRGDMNMLINKFSMSMIAFYFIYIFSVLVFITAGPLILNVIGSKAILPSSNILMLFCLVSLLEQNHSSFATIIVTGNSVPFVKAAIASGLSVIICSFFTLSLFHAGVLGLVLSQGICQLAYNNWKWPKFVLDEFGMSYISFLKTGLIQLKKEVISYYGENRKNIRG